MADTDIVQVIAETRIDARSLSEFVFKPADFMVTRRLAPPINTLNFYIDRLENYTAGLDAKTTQVNAELTTKANQAKASIDGAVTRANATADSVASSAANTARTRIDKILNDAIKDSGFVIVDSFEDGSTLTTATQALRVKATGKLYRWGGALPKVVSASSTPQSTGGFGFNAWVEVNDVALKQELGGLGGNWLVNNQMAAFAYGTPAPLSNVVTSTGTHKVIEYFDGKFWATRVGNIYTSSDRGLTWDLVKTGKVASGIIPTNDGEMLFLYGDKVEKSTGWNTNPQTATWRTVVSLPAQTAQNWILRWGFDGDGTKFILNHYGDTSGITSRCWISTDMGDTWSVVVNSVDDYNNPYHMHCVCYDQWEDRFWLSMGHGAASGLYYSDNDGKDWTMLKEYSYEHDGTKATFTTMTPTDFGIVCGTDLQPNGIYILRRSANPDDIKLEMAGEWRDPNRGGLLGFALRGFRDPDTGVVYVGFTASSADIDPVIMACGSGGASVVYTAKKGTSDRRFNNVVAAEGLLYADMLNPTENLKAETATHTRTGIVDFGNVLTESPTFVSSVVAGVQSKTDANRNVVIGYKNRVITNPITSIEKSDVVSIGYNTTVTSSGSVAIGSGSRGSYRSVSIGMGALTGADETATATSAVAVGYLAQALQANTVAIGGESQALSYTSTALGSKASASLSGIAIGFNALSNKNNSVSIGANSSAVGESSVTIGGSIKNTSHYSVAIGSGSSVSGTDTVAVGRTANASGVYAVAIGSGSKATAGESVAVGRYSEAATDSVGYGGGAKATGLYSSALGSKTISSGSYTVAIGHTAEATANYSTAIGQAAKATHVESVAIGAKTVSTRANTVAVGARDIESTKNGGAIYLKSPDGTAYKITVSDAGELTVATV